jgi:hypothetical protein
MFSRVWLTSAVFSFSVCVLTGTATAQTREGTSEIFVFAGGSLLEVSQDADRFLFGLDSSAPGPMFGPGGMFTAGMLFGPGGLFGGPRGVFGPGGIFGPGQLPAGVDYLPNWVRERRVLGRSFLFGVQYSYYISDRATLEGTFSVAPAHDLEREFSFDCPDTRVCALLGTGTRDAPFRMDDTTVVTYHYGANLGFDLTRGSWRPMALAGLGGVSFDGEGDSRTSFVFRFGGGVKGYFGRLGVRADVSDNLVFDHFLTGGTEHDLQVRGGVLVHWR